MTLEALRCFCAVIDTGGFGTAADRLHRTQPAVSQQLKGLERDLGQKLVQRGTSRATPAGQLLYGRAKLILNAVDDLDREFQDFDETVHVPLRVGASDTSAMYFLPRVLREFAKAMPQVRVALSTKSSALIESEVLSGEIDLGVVSFPARSTELAGRRLFAQRLVLVVPRGHQLAGKRRLALSRLLGEPMILLDESTRTGEALRDLFERIRFQPNVAMRSGSFEVIKRYAAEGAGVAILPEMCVTKGEDARLTVVRISELPTIEIGAIWRERGYLPKAAKHLLEQMTRDTRRVS